LQYPTKSSQTENTYTELKKREGGKYRNPEHHGNHHPIPLKKEIKTILRD